MRAIYLLMSLSIFSVVNIANAAEKLAQSRSRHDPPQPGRLEGGITDFEITTRDVIWVPNLLGKSASHESLKTEIPGWTIKVVGREKSSVPRGLILRQTPAPSTEVNRVGPIKVFVSSGP